ncbi:MAG TPA: hypothetical protein VIJ35_09275 [Bradyrhizobium sp.]
MSVDMPSMRSFRSKTHLGGRCALIAMVLQLVLTFGHVHPPLLAQASTGAALSLATVFDGPGSHEPNGSADRDCPVCALIHLSAAAAPSVAPDLPLPASVDFVTLRPHAELASDTSPHFQAKARAPPSI